jgi:hypothetical protein
VINYFAHNSAIDRVLNHISATFPQLCLWITSFKLKITTAILCCLQPFVDVYISVELRCGSKIADFKNADENNDGSFC